jgi:ribosome production factor 2
MESAFSNNQSIEYFGQKNNTPLFAYTSDQKKKPMNLVLGSLFNFKVLDMFEYEVTNYIPISHFSEKVLIDSCMKPVIIFQGDLFETDFQLERMRRFFLDLFKLHDVDEVNISELRRVMIISVAEDREIKIRSFQVEGQIKEFSLDHLQLTEVGPSLNLKVRNIHLASKEFYDLALRQPKEAIIKKEKNIENNALGEKRGRIHMAKQNLNAVSLKKYKKILGKDRFKKKEKKSDIADIEV